MVLDREQNAPSAWYGNLPVTSRYTFGLAGEHFFRALKDDARIMGTHCRNCQRIYVPGVLFCERCLSELSEWVDVGTVGEIFTFTILYEDIDGSPKETPEVVAFVKIADGGIIHRISELDLETIEIGISVEAVFKPADERSGGIVDILYFKPVN